ncbi:MAG: response regulator [Rhodoferax sp.]
MPHPTLAHVLVVDDDPDITALLQAYLQRFGLACNTAHDGASMWEALRLQPVDLVVLDVMLPGEDGLSLARQVRQHSRLPVIMLTARSEPYDRILGLENGADDYMAKPFEPRELVARIQTVLRRCAQASTPAAVAAQAPVVCFDGWELHRDQRCLVSAQRVSVPLSNAEYRLLCVFLHAPRRLLSREQLMELARGRGFDGLDRSIDLLVSRLRAKLDDEAAGTGLIKTVRGSGYLFNAHAVRGRAAWTACA